MKEATTTRDYDWWLLAIVAAICALGVVEIYSATHGSALAGMHMKQIRWLVIGFVIYFGYGRRHSVMSRYLKKEITEHGVSPAGAPVVD